MREPLDLRYFCFFFNDTATTEIYTLSLHDALPICQPRKRATSVRRSASDTVRPSPPFGRRSTPLGRMTRVGADRKSTRLNSSHANISYAVFCLKKKKETYIRCIATVRALHHRS